MTEERTDPGEIQVIMPKQAKPETGSEDGFDLDSRSRSIARKSAQGWTQSRIADAHDISSKTVWRTLQISEVKDYVEFLLDERYSDAPIDRVVDLADKSVDRLADLVDSTSDSVALRAVIEVIRTSEGIRDRRALERKFNKLVDEIEARLEAL